MNKPHSATKNLTLLILILGSITSIGPLAIDMYLPAFLAISKNLNTNEKLVQLSLTSCFIGLAIGQILYGPIIDRFGKKIPLIVGLTLFTISSIACYFAQNINQLIVLRFFQAVGVCSGLVIPRAIIRDTFTPQESARVFSYLMLVMGLAPILAPIGGSFILTFASWRVIFAFLGIFGIFCLILTHLTIKETTAPNPDDKISHAFKKYAGILRDQNFTICAISSGLVMAALFSYITGSPFAYLEFFNLSAKEYAILFSLNSVGFIAASQINAYLLKTLSITEVLKRTLLIPPIASIAIIITNIYSPSFWPVTIILFIFLGSVGAILPSMTALALTNQSKHSGSASALFGTIQFSLATIMSFAISKFHDGTLNSLVFVISSCGILSYLIYKIFLKKEI